MLSTQMPPSVRNQAGSWGVLGLGHWLGVGGAGTLSFSPLTHLAPGRGHCRGVRCWQEGLGPLPELLGCRDLAASVSQAQGTREPGEADSLTRRYGRA